MSRAPFFLSALPRRREFALFPYTTLFRSARQLHDRAQRPGGELHGQRRESPPRGRHRGPDRQHRSEEHTSELQSPCNLVCRLLLEKKKEGGWIEDDETRTILTGVVDAINQ